MADDRHWMQRALTLAERGMGAVEPNPRVGAVVVRAEQVLGEGYHASFGGPHAEAAALADCRARGHDPAGATVYVNLEPCAHQGKQPACVDALIEARVARVVVAMEDPSAAMRGQSLARLREAGIEVTSGIEQAAAHWLNRAFVMRLTEGRPWVIAKWAQTIDGKIATQSGDSQWISGASARQRVHAWRGEVDAILVGPGTFAQDNPTLTARGDTVHRKARRVVVAPSADQLPGQTLLETEGPPVTLAVADDEPTRTAVEKQVASLARSNVTVVGCASDAGGRLDLGQLLTHLAEAHDASQVLVEGGGGVIGDLLRRDLIDEMRVFVAPKILGDERGTSSVTGLRREAIAEADTFALHHIERIDDDVLLTYRKPAANAL